MFIIGRGNRDSEYDDFCGVTDIRVVPSLKEAIRICEENTEVTRRHLPDEYIINPAWGAWYNSKPKTTYRQWIASEVPRLIPNPLPNPHDDYYVTNDWLIFACREDGSAIEERDDQPPDWWRNHNKPSGDLFGFEDFMFTVYPLNTKKEDDDLV